MDGHEIHYESSGAGSPLILIHGGWENLSSWKSQVPYFSKSYRTIVYDRWGHGLSGRRKTLEPDWYVNDAVELVELMDRLSIDKATVVGFSDGGTIALVAGSRNPGRFSGIVVEGAHVLMEKKTKDYIRKLKPFAQSSEGRAWLEERHGAAADDVVKGWFDFWESVTEEWNILGTLTGISVPTLVIIGSNDETSTVDQARKVAQSIPHSTLWIADGCPHSVHESAASSFNPRVAEFLHSI